MLRLDDVSAIGREEREADAPVPVALAESIVAAMPNARLELIPAGGHRLDIGTLAMVDPLLLQFLLDVGS